MALLNAAGRWNPMERTEPQRMRDAYRQVRSAHAVSLGASVGTAIDFDAMCLPGARFFNNGQDIFEMEALAELILSQPEPPKYFFVTLLPAALNQDNGLRATGGSNRRRFTYRFLHEMGKWGMIEGDWRQALLSEAMPAIGHDLRDPWYGATLYFLGRLPPVDETPAADTDAIGSAAALAQARVDIAQRQADLQRFAYFDPDIPARTKEALRRMLTKIQSSGGTMIIVVTPVTSPLREEMAQHTAGEVAEFEELLEQLESDGAVIANHLDGSPYVAEFEHFRDADHLNAPGAAAFSARLGEDLRARDVLPSVECRKMKLSARYGLG